MTLLKSIVIIYNEKKSILITYNKKKIKHFCLRLYRTGQLCLYRIHIYLHTIHYWLRREVNMDLRRSNKAAVFLIQLWNSFKVAFTRCYYSSFVSLRSVKFCVKKWPWVVVCNFFLISVIYTMECRSVSQITRRCHLGNNLLLIFFQTVGAFTCWVK